MHAIIKLQWWTINTLDADAASKTSRILKQRFEPRQLRHARRRSAFNLFHRAGSGDYATSAYTQRQLEVVEEWQRLYSWAWADFVRFLAGWAPHHYKIDRYSLQLTEDVLRMLEKREKQL